MSAMPDVRQLSPELAEKAQSELGENPQRLKDDIMAIRSWIEKQSHLIARTDDQFIVAFLRFCRFSLEESKKRLECYFTCKSIYPDLFKNRPIDAQVLDIIHSGLHIIPADPLPSGSKLFITKLGNFDVKNHTFSDLFKVQLMLYEILAFEDDSANVNGIEHVFDFKECTFQQVLHSDPVIMKKSYIYEYQALPLRVVRAHLINLRKELQGAFKFASSLLPSELSFEVILHEEEKDVFNYVPQECFTFEYGGSNGKLSELAEKWVKILKDHTEYFEKDSQYGTNEKLRQGPITNLQTDFGIEGSFRKLEVD